MPELRTIRNYFSEFRPRPAPRQMRILDGTHLIVAKYAQSSWRLETQHLTQSEKNAITKITFVEYPEQQEDRVSLDGNRRQQRYMGEVVLVSFLSAFPNCGCVVFQGHTPDLRECSAVGTVGMRLVVIEYSDQFTDEQILNATLFNPGRIHFNPDERGVSPDIYRPLLPSYQNSNETIVAAQRAMRDVLNSSRQGLDIERLHVLAGTQVGVLAAVLALIYSARALARHSERDTDTAIRESTVSRLGALSESIENQRDVRDFTPFAEQMRAFANQPLPLYNEQIFSRPGGGFYVARNEAELRSRLEQVIEEAKEQAHVRPDGTFSNVKSMPLTPSAHSAKEGLHTKRPEDELSRYRKHLRDYVESFCGKVKFTEQLKRLKLTPSEQKELEDKYLDPMTFEVMDIPVSVHEIYYDLDTLLRLSTPVTPTGAFDYHDIQVARIHKMAPLKKFIEDVKARIALDRKVVAEEANSEKAKIRAKRILFFEGKFGQQQGKEDSNTSMYFGKR